MIPITDRLLRSIIKRGKGLHQVGAQEVTAVIGAKVEGRRDEEKEIKALRTRGLKQKSFKNEREIRSEADCHVSKIPRCLTEAFGIKI